MCFDTTQQFSVSYGNSGRPTIRGGAAHLRNELEKNEIRMLVAKTLWTLERLTKDHGFAAVVLMYCVNDAKA
jgi:hypothetical protein